jgi:uncharacterized glyoxalase superfamily metalloenzyme YdcJ
MNNRQFKSGSDIRAQFAAAMSDMYRNEVPLYGELIGLVQQVNQWALEDNPTLHQQADESGTLRRLSAERHGAIRLGTGAELFTMRRLFAVMGMVPVGYYDLTEAGLPVHSTAFRPLALEELNANPFRVFTSLLRLDLIDDEDLREQAKALLEKRFIYSPALIQLIEFHETQGGLNQQQVEEFVAEALETFRWHRRATVDLQTYRKFASMHRLIADIVCFRGPHINHLTPRTLDIDSCQKKMRDQGMHPKAIIEGPPPRKVPILLRQTSFKALDEAIEFIDDSGQPSPGSHNARFGEIEQRGMALTPKGRAKYDELLREVRQLVPDNIDNTEKYNDQLLKVFARFTDDLVQLHQQGLGYVRYIANKERLFEQSHGLDDLIEKGSLRITPITYEDFLPVSAAGIFQSNLDENKNQSFDLSPNQQAFEIDLGRTVINEFEFYRRIQRESLIEALKDLDISASINTHLIDEFDKRYS